MNAGLHGACGCHRALLFAVRKYCQAEEYYREECPQSRVFRAFAGRRRGSPRKHWAARQGVLEYPIHKGFRGGGLETTCLCAFQRRVAGSALFIGISGGTSRKGRQYVGFRTARHTKPTRRTQPEHPNSPDAMPEQCGRSARLRPSSLLAGLLLALREKVGKAELLAASGQPTFNLVFFACGRGRPECPRPRRAQ